MFLSNLKMRLFSCVLVSLAVVQNEWLAIDSQTEYAIARPVNVRR